MKQLILGTGTAIWWLTEPHCRNAKQCHYPKCRHAESVAPHSLPFSLDLPPSSSGPDVRAFQNLQLSPNGISPPLSPPPGRQARMRKSCSGRRSQTSSERSNQRLRDKEPTACKLDRLVMTKQNVCCYETV